VGSGRTLGGTIRRATDIMTVTKKDRIRALLKSIETGDPGPVAIVNEAKYIQHNPQTREGSEGLAALFQRLSRTSPRVNIVRAFEDGEFVFAHTEYDFASRKIGFEIFRFEDGQVVEHWDNIQERRGPNQSGRIMVDGPTEAVDLELTEYNRALVQSFVEIVLVDGHLDRLVEFIDEETYAEHNPRLGDGVSNLRSALEVEDESGRRIDYHRVHRNLAEGNFVLCVSEGSYGGCHTAFYDLFRLAKGKVVEHWDTSEKIAPRSEWKNDNGKF
jgi:predicted SnoaL-like aldol condensation-catalyzing enzyme